MSEQIRQDLEAAYEVLEEHGWCQTPSGVTDDGKVCIEAAVAQVTLGSPCLWGIEPQPEFSMGFDLVRTDWRTGERFRDSELDVARYRNAIDALSEHIDWSGFSRHLDRQVWAWNDQKHRTVDEVKDLIRTTIKGLQ